MSEIAIGAYYCHKKTGHIYQVLLMAKLEKTLEDVVIYGRGRERWVRPLSEFLDGRFEPVDMSLVSPKGPSK
jgi:hypothetical protein